MSALRFLLKSARLAPGVVALGLALMVTGCSRDGDKVVVDFSKTVPVARPGDRPSPHPPLRAIWSHLANIRAFSVAGGSKMTSCGGKTRKRSVSSLFFITIDLARRCSRSSVSSEFNAAKIKATALSGESA
jgi:hypothetical protein